MLFVLHNDPPNDNNRPEICARRNEISYARIAAYIIHRTGPAPLHMSPNIQKNADKLAYNGSLGRPRI